METLLARQQDISSWLVKVLKGALFFVRNLVSELARGLVYV
jgi:hypoxanthine-guanine phosphoribosyltransferase